MQPEIKHTCLRINCNAIPHYNHAVKTGSDEDMRDYLATVNIALQSAVNITNVTHTCKRCGVVLLKQTDY